MPEPDLEMPDVPTATAEGPTSDETMWGLIAHLSTFTMYITGIGMILGPVIVYIVKKEQSAFVRHHAAEAINFNISILIYLIISGILCFVLIGFLLVPIVLLAHVVLSIIAALKAKDGELYKYPLTIRMIS